MKRLNLLDLVYISLFAGIMAICAWIFVPAPVPFTLQTLGLFLSVGILGGKRGFFSVLLYLLLGLVGVPVFSGFTGGFSAFAGLYGGYLIGFLLASLAMWLFMHFFKGRRFALTASMIIGLLICYLTGALWFVLVHARTAGSVGLIFTLTTCVLPFILPDAIKIALAVLISKRVSKFIRQY